MRIRAFTAACLVSGCMLPLAQPMPAWAQDTTKGKFTLALEAGMRGYTKEPDALAKGKFEEYRDMRSGAVVEQLLLNYTPADSFGFYSLSARNLFQRDQSVWLQARRPGNYDFQLRWDRIPHTYSTDARSPGNEFNPGFNTLPVPRPDSLAWRNAPYIGAVRTQWDPVKASLGLTPSNNLDFKGEYVRIGKSGGIPLSLSFSGSSGPQREFVAPIDQTMHDVRLSQGYTSGARTENSALSFIKSFQVVGTYGYSRFLNGMKSAMVDNPQQAVNTFAAGAASGRVSMPPDNAAQTGTLTGALMLPAHTRVMGTASGTWMSQNDVFLPQSSNDSLARDPNFGLLTLPRTSLDGKTRSLVYNVSATSRPIDKLTLAAKYRNYDRSDQTAAFHVKAIVISDRTVTPGDSADREPLPFTKANTDLSASYQILADLSLTGAYFWEDWTRSETERNTAKTSEKGPRGSLDYNGLDWLNLHASYSTTERRGDSYTLSATEITGFRRFDLSDRDRKRTTLLATVMPIDNLDVSFNYLIDDNKYPNSQYGTQSDKSTEYGADVDWSPISWFSASAGYSKEDATNVLNMRYRTGAVGSVTDDNPTYKWTNTNTDKNTTTYASFRASLIPDKLDLTGSFSNIDGHFWVYNVNPVPPSGGTATNILNATAENWPEVTQNLKPFSVALRYRYSEDWAVTTRFQSEQYAQTDFRTSAPLFAPFLGQNGPLPGSIGAVTGTNTGQYHFMGNTYLPYTANWFTVLISFHPASIPFLQGRSTL